jgi:hypothetical protein
VTAGPRFTARLLRRELRRAAAVGAAVAALGRRLAGGEMLPIGERPLGQQSGSKRLKSAPLNMRERCAKGPHARTNRAIA